MDEIEAIMTDGVCNGDFGDDTIRSLELELEELAVQHGMPSKSRRKNVLQPRHMKEFSGSTVFDEFARAVCMSDSVMRKELFEAWAMALYVHRSFPSSRRVADLACSHGLVSWALLLLSLSSNESRHPSPFPPASEEKQQEQGNDENIRRTAVCIDKFMPRSVELLEKSMTNQWPDLVDCWHYVEAPLEGTLPSHDTLLVGVHCCGTLSDLVIDLAIHGNSPLALVPCCHSKKCLKSHQRIELFGEPSSKKSKVPEEVLAEYIDDRRVERLRAAGYDIREARIPLAFTPKNRIILASPRKSPETSVDNEPPSTDAAGLHPTLLVASLHEKQESKKKIMRSWQDPIFEIPVGNNQTARATVKSLSGRLASVDRRHPPPRTFCFKISYPPKPFTLEEFKEVVCSMVPSLHVHVVHKYEDEKIMADGEVLRTIQVFCENPDGGGDGPGSKRRSKNLPSRRQPVDKQVMRQLHLRLCEEIPKIFPGTIIRQTPR